jgi:hypothetical protein
MNITWELGDDVPIEEHWRDQIIFYRKILKVMCISFDEGASSKKGCGATWLERNSSYEATLHSGKVLYVKRITNGRPAKV